MRKERNKPRYDILALKKQDHACNCKELNKSIPSSVLDGAGK